jgi:hypothetical protein
MTLQRFVNSLRRQEQFTIAIKLARLALPIWDDYATQDELDYMDSVVGMSHTVDKKILVRTVDAVEKYVQSEDFKNGNHIKNRFSELLNEFLDPMVALQDLDWELPNEVKLTFYAIHNLLDAATGYDQTPFGEATIFVSINQSIDALTSSKRMAAEDVHSAIGLLKK